jgi:hypothetical protein
MSRIEKPLIGINDRHFFVSHHQQMLDCFICRCLVVDGYIRGLICLAVFTALDHRICTAQLFDVRHIYGGVHRDHAVGHAVAQEIQVDVFPLHIGVCRAQENVVVIAACYVFNALHDFGVKRIGDAGNEDKQHAAFRTAEIAPKHVGIVLEALNDGFDFCSGHCGYGCRMIQHAGYSGNGYTSFLCYFLNGCHAFGFPFQIVIDYKDNVAE